MRKIFLDIGTHNGQTLELGIQRYPNCDLYIGIEPVTSLCEKAIGKCAKYKDKNIKIYNIALDSFKGEIREQSFFFDQTPGNKNLGSSLYQEKTMRKQKKITVKCWDINHFFQTNFNSEDNIIMKIDVEGKEYDLFEALIGTGKINWVKKIFAEWHWNKVPSITKDRHDKVVTLLTKLGFNLTGDSKKDEFYDGF